MALFRSELHVPVKRDEMTFQDRQVKSWEDMEVRMEKRRKEWDSEFESMKNEFFKLKPTEKCGSSNAVDTLDNLKTIFVNDLQGGQKFKVRFDVSEFRPEEIQVRVQDNKIAVSAKHEEKSTSSSVSKEYSRQVDIPSNVDQDKLQCILSKDGILSIEGPVRGQILGKETMLPIQHAVSSVCPTTNGTTGTNGMSCSPSPNNQIAIARPLEVSTNTVKNPIITEPDGTRKLRLSVDVGEFKPEGIVVKTDKKKLIVHAEHEEKLTGRTMHKEFNKEYELPDSVDQTAISAYIGEEGKLYIEAPLKQVAQKRYSITQSHDVRKVVVTKESQVTVTDNQNRPLVTINVHRR